jgi:hypothetical protein
MNLRSLVPVGAAAAELAGAPLASASTGSTHGTHQRTQTIQLVAKQAQSPPIEVDKKGHSLGDQLVIAEDLYQNAKKIGDQAVMCTYVHIGPDELQCLGTFAMPRGRSPDRHSSTSRPAPPPMSPSPVARAPTAAQGGYVHTVPAGTTERHLTFHVTR